MTAWQIALTRLGRPGVPDRPGDRAVAGEGAVIPERIEPENVPWPMASGARRRVPTGALVLAGIALAGVLAFAWGWWA